MIALSGVLNSWLMFAKNLLLARFASAASSLALSSSAVRAFISTVTWSDIFSKARDIRCDPSSTSSSSTTLESDNLRKFSISLCRRALASPSSSRAKRSIFSIMILSRLMRSSFCSCFIRLTLSILSLYEASARISCPTSSWSLWKKPLRLLISTSVLPSLRFCNTVIALPKPDRSDLWITKIIPTISNTVKRIAPRVFLI